MSATVTRYVVTRINEDGLRVMVGPAQGRFTYETAEEAQRILNAIFYSETNSPKTLSMIYGNDPRPEVRPCKCYAGHFDPVGIYFD